MKLLDPLVTEVMQTPKKDGTGEVNLFMATGQVVLSVFSYWNKVHWKKITSS